MDICGITTLLFLHHCKFFQGVGYGSWRLYNHSGYSYCGSASFSSGDTDWSDWKMVQRGAFQDGAPA